jgi:ankyrin repeat protein
MNITGPNSEKGHTQELLRYAVQKGESGVLEWVLENWKREPLDIYATDEHKRTLMWLAAEKKDKKMIEKLRGWDGITLHFMVKDGELSLVKELLAAGYNVDRPDIYQQTALHIATSREHLDIAKELISEKADVNSRNVDGNSPIRLAILQKSHEFVDFLLQSSANTLPDGWIPIDGAEFLIRFLHHLSTRWFSVCDKAEEHLASCVS